MDLLGGGNITSKEYLLQHRTLRYKRANALDQLHSIIEDVATEGLAISYDADRVQTSPSNDALFKAHERIEERSKHLDKYLEHIDEELLKIETEIDGLKDGLHSRILYLVYVKDYDLNEVAKEVDYSPDTINHRHGDALEEFRRMYLT